MFARCQRWCNDKLRGRGAPQLRGRRSHRLHAQAPQLRGLSSRADSDCGFACATIVASHVQLFRIFFFDLLSCAFLSPLHFLLSHRSSNCSSSLCFCSPPSLSSPLSSLSCVVFVIFIPVLLITISLHLPYFPRIVSVLSAKLSYVGLCVAFVKSISRSSCTCLYLLVVLFDQIIMFC